MQPAAELLVDGCLRPGMQRLPGHREARADLGRVLRQVGQNGGGRPSPSSWTRADRLHRHGRPLAENANEAPDYVKALLSYLPTNNLDPPPVADVPPVDVTVPDGVTDLSSTPPSRTRRHPYDMHTVVELVLDDGRFPRGAGHDRADGPPPRPGTRAPSLATGT
jgi:hypothetical protein